MKYVDLSVFQSALIAVFLLVGAGTTFIGALGLIRLRLSFYERVHAPTLGTTLGTFCIAVASLVYFSTKGSGINVQEVLIVLCVTVTTPISLVVLVKAAFLRDAAETKANEEQIR